MRKIKSFLYIAIGAFVELAVPIKTTSIECFSWVISTPASYIEFQGSSLGYPD
jgi:hypothetical protein